VFYTSNETEVMPKIGTALIFKQDVEHAGLPIVEVSAIE